MNRRLIAIGAWVVIGILTTGCSALVPLNQRVLDNGRETVRLRSMQTRYFETTDRERTLRDVVATLRDLEFIIAKADATLGVVSGTKQWTRITVTVSPRGAGQMAVRANLQQQLALVEDPEAYRAFFAALAKAMFLTAHQVD
jgi:hypothetical protein